MAVLAQACSPGIRPTTFYRSNVSPRFPLRRSLVSLFKRDIALRAEGPKVAGPAGIAEEADPQIIASSFKAADEAAAPSTEIIPGLQAFAGSIIQRRNSIPSQTYKDPYKTLFEEFDLNHDGHLTAEEAATALLSRGVKITAEQVKKFITEVDTNNNGTIEQNEFGPMITKMASRQLRSLSIKERK